jgi:hypothetical protein
MTRSAADVDDAAAVDRLATGKRLFIAHHHCAAEQPIDDAFERAVIVAVDRIEIDGVVVKKLGRATVHGMVPAGMYFSNDET